MQSIAISITGFSGADLLHVERLIALVGADYYTTMTRRRSILLTPEIEISGQKMMKAKEWNVPVVRIGWLYEVIRQGDEEVNIAPWCDHPLGTSHDIPNQELVRYTPDEASSSLKTGSGVAATCPPRIGKQISGAILNGCVIFISKKLDALAGELSSIAEYLGAHVAKKFDPVEVTHLIHQSSRATETFREFRQARTANIAIVHPQWLFECRSRGTRCDEEAWGWMWDADKNLPIFGGIERKSAPPEMKREKRLRQDENTPPERSGMSDDPVKVEQLTKLLGNVSSPQKKTRRKLAGRARNTQTTTTSSAQSPEDVFIGHEDDGPRPTQERVEYKDPIAEREMAKIIANLQGVEEEKVLQVDSDGMTPAEDIGRRGGRRKSARK
jgi:hypothetical protein